jgi:hypothetical protein
MASCRVIRNPFFEGAGYQQGVDDTIANGPWNLRQLSNNQSSYLMESLRESEGAPSALDAAVRGQNGSFGQSQTGIFNYGSLAFWGDSIAMSPHREVAQVAVQQVSSSQKSGFFPSRFSFFSGKTRGYQVINEDSSAEEGGWEGCCSPQLTDCLGEYQTWMRERVHDTREWLGVQLAPHVLVAVDLQELIVQVESLLPHIGVDVTYHEEEGRPETGRFLIHKRDMYRAVHRYFCITPQAYRDRLGSQENAVAKMKYLLCHDFFRLLENTVNKKSSLEGGSRWHPYDEFSQLIEFEDGIITRKVLQEFSQNKHIFELLTDFFLKDYVILGSDSSIILEAKEKVQHSAEELLFREVDPQSSQERNLPSLLENAINQLSVWATNLTKRGEKIQEKNLITGLHTRDEKTKEALRMEITHKITLFQKNIGEFQRELKKFVGKKLPEYFRDGASNILEQLREFGLAESVVREVALRVIGWWGCPSLIALASRGRILEEDDLLTVEKIFNELQGELYRTLENSLKNENKNFSF